MPPPYPSQPRGKLQLADRRAVLDRGQRRAATDHFSQGVFDGALSGLAGSLVADLLVPGKQDWAQIAIGAVGGGLAGGLAQLRAYDTTRGDDYSSVEVLESISGDQTDPHRDLSELQEEITARARTRSESMPILGAIEPEVISTLGLTAAISKLPTVVSAPDELALTHAELTDIMRRVSRGITSKLFSGLDIDGADGVGRTAPYKLGMNELSPAAMTKRYGLGCKPSKSVLAFPHHDGHFR